MLGMGWLTAGAPTWSTATTKQEAISKATDEGKFILVMGHRET